MRFLIRYVNFKTSLIYLNLALTSLTVPQSLYKSGKAIARLSSAIVWVHFVADVLVRLLLMSGQVLQGGIRNERGDCSHYCGWCWLLCHRDDFSSSKSKIRLRHRVAVRYLTHTVGTLPSPVTRTFYLFSHEYFVTNYNDEFSQDHSELTARCLLLIKMG